MRNVIGLLIVSFCFLACNRNVNQNVPDGFSQEDCTKNDSGDYLLCVKSENPVKNEIPPIQYSILDNEGKTIQKGSISRGTVTWLDNEAVQIFEIPGNMSTDLSENDITRVYVIKTGEVMSKTDYLKQN
jgi:hypothetical protein